MVDFTAANHEVEVSKPVSIKEEIREEKAPEKRSSLLVYIVYIITNEEKVL